MTEITHRDLLNAEHRRIADEATEKIKRLIGAVALERSEDDE